MQPLTHHEILTLAAPFTRQGRHVDLAASDRLQRRLVFKPAAPAAGVLDTLQLQPADGATHRLTRVLDFNAGVQARLVVDGADPADLLRRIDEVPWQRQFGRADGCVLAFSHQLDGTATGDAALTLTGAQACIGNTATLTLDVPPGRRVSATLVLQPAAGQALSLPEDLLAVLGWSWSRLTPRDGGWRCNLQLRGRGGPARGRDAEMKLRRSAAHLVQTLAEPPARFHERHLAGRWKMSLRRGIPLLACLALFAAAVIVPQLALGQESVMRMLVFNAPPLLLGLFFGLREMPRFEIPPLPRRPREASWSAAAANTSSERQPV